MGNRVYKIIELVGTSEESIENAIENGIAEAKNHYKNLDWFEVVETRGLIENQKAKYYQIRLKIGCYDTV